jgi:hypothetical protein
MTMVHAQLIGDKAVLSRDEFEYLVELARRSEHIELQVEEDTCPTAAIMQLAEAGGTFDFWKEEGEDLYSEEDGEPV